MKPVAIQGLGLACALGADHASSVSALREGRISAPSLDVMGFDEPLAMPYYRVPDGARLFDPARMQALVAQVCAEACRGLSPAERERLPVFVGSTSFGVTAAEADYLKLLSRDPQARFSVSRVTYEETADLARRALGSRAQTWCFNTACTASANALLYAARCIDAGLFDRALVLGVELANRVTLGGFAGLQLVSGALKPFDRDRQGIVLGEGLAAVLLSRDPQASRLRLLGGACNSDLYSVTTANPDGNSIAAVQAQALRDAGVDAAQIRLLKAHGTGSPMNDTGEAAGIRTCFATPPPVLGLKAYTGHTLGACGAVELALMAGALNEGWLPATAGFETADPALGLSPLSQELKAGPGAYLLNYFGFGGNNASLVVEQAA